MAPKAKKLTLKKTGHIGAVLSTTLAFTSDKKKEGSPKGYSVRGRASIEQYSITALWYHNITVYNIRELQGYGQRPPEAGLYLHPPIMGCSSWG